MNCKQAQRDIALWAGHDLDCPAEKEAVRRHVTTCPCCRNHYQQMKDTLRTLERAERPATYVSGDSLWPALASRISHAQHQTARQRNTDRFNGWMPFIAMTAACCILLLVVSDRPQSPTSPTRRGFSPLPAPASVLSAERSAIDSWSSTQEFRSFEERPAAEDARLLEELRKRQQRSGY